MQVDEIFDTASRLRRARGAARVRCCCCRSISPSAATCAGCAPGWSASPTTRSRTSPRARRILDRAETELEELLGRAASRSAGTTPATPMTAADRVTHERPALERITMERAALEPHPRWRRFAAGRPSRGCWSRSGSSRCCSAPAAIFASEELLERPTRDRAGPRVGAIDPAEVTVAVLNGTSVNGLAGKVGSDVEANGYELGAMTSTTPGFEQDRGPVRRRPEASGAEGRPRPRRRQAIGRADRPRDPEARRRADVVVIAGEDRAVLSQRARRSARRCSSPSLVATLVTAVLVVRARTPDLVLEVPSRGQQQAVLSPAGDALPRAVLIEFFVRESDAARPGGDRRQQRETSSAPSTPTSR